MKQGKSLSELAAELERRASAKKDFSAPSDKWALVADEAARGPEDVRLELKGVDSFPVADYAHGQIATHAGIPKGYYDRMLAEKPALLAENVNTWLKAMPASAPESGRMIRTLDRKVRAVLSTKYRALENEDLAEAVLPVLLQGNAMVLSSEVTDRRLYIKAVDSSIVRDVPTGRRMGDGSHVFFDTVSPAIVISNSEVGAGTLRVETSIFTKVCTNLAMMGASVKKYHAGARVDFGEEVQALLSDQTRKAADEALWMTVRDVTRGAFEEARFEANVQKLGQAATQPIEAPAVEVIERARKKFSWTEAEGHGVLEHLIRNGDLTQYGLHAAVTRAAEDLESYDRASEFEALGGQIIELPRSEWRALAQAA